MSWEPTKENIEKLRALAEAANIRDNHHPNYSPSAGERLEHVASVVILPLIEKIDELELDLKKATVWKDEDDHPLPEDAEIEAAFPTRSGKHEIYAEAMRMVSARYSKSGLIALVNMLLHRIAKARGGW